MNKYIIAALLVSGSVMAAPPPGPYNQTMTYNQNMQFGSTNWYSSPLGQGAAMAGVAIVSGLVNAMNRPDPVVVVPSSRYGSQSSYGAPQQAQYGGEYKTQGAPQYSGPSQYANNGNCRMQTLYDQSGNPRYVKVCD